MNIVNESSFRRDRNAPEFVSFHRLELNQILQVYGRMVVAGEWKDYGISHLPDAAIFCVFRRSSDLPLYRIEKRPRSTSKQGVYCILGMDGRILERGSDLAAVMRFFDRKLIRLVAD